MIYIFGTVFEGGFNVDLFRVILTGFKNLNNFILRQAIESVDAMRICGSNFCSEKSDMTTIDITKKLCYISGLILRIMLSSWSWDLRVDGCKCFRDRLSKWSTKIMSGNCILLARPFEVNINFYVLFYHPFDNSIYIKRKMSPFWVILFRNIFEMVASSIAPFAKNKNLNFSLSCTKMNSYF